MNLPLNTPALLRAWGLDVVEVPGWQTRTTRAGRTVTPRALICHYTWGVDRPHEDMPTLHILRDGYTGLPGPLSQFGLGRSGRVYVVAAGHCNHAGTGNWHGASGNAQTVGIEAEWRANWGPWPAVQIDAYMTLGAALLRDVLRLPIGQLCGHQDYATPRGRKGDPGWGRAGFPSLAAFRAEVQARMTRGPGGHSTPPAAPTAPAVPAGYPGVLLRDGSRGQAVSRVQRTVGAADDGIYGPQTTAKVRAWQAAHGLAADGIVGPLTWAAMFDGAAAPAPSPAPPPAPAPARPQIAVDGLMGPQTIAALQRWLGIPADGLMGPQTRRALQARLSVAQDGIWGPLTVRALQRLVGAPEDGKMGPQTIAAIQTYLNARGVG